MGSGEPYSYEWKNRPRSSTGYRYSTTNAATLEKSKNTTPPETELTNTVTIKNSTKKINIDYKKALIIECMQYKGFISNVFKSQDIDDETKYSTFFSYINRIIDILGHIDKTKAEQLKNEYNSIFNEYKTILQKYKESEMKKEKQKYDAIVKGAKLEENLSFRTIDTEIIEFSNKIDAYTGFADRIINL